MTIPHIGPAPRPLIFTLVCTDIEGEHGYAERRYVVLVGDEIVWTDPMQSSSYDDTRERERAEGRFAAALRRMFGG